MWPSVPTGVPKKMRYFFDVGDLLGSNHGKLTSVIEEWIKYIAPIAPR